MKIQNRLLENLLASLEISHEGDKHAYTHSAAIWCFLQIMKDICQVQKCVYYIIYAIKCQILDYFLK